MPIDSPPAEVNYPPFVDPGAVRPTPARELSYSRATDEELVFQTGPIEDPNEDDRIFWRWFYNYDNDAGFKLIFEDSPPEGRAPELLPDGLRFTLRPCAVPIETAAGVRHRVDLIIADRPFVPTSEEPPDAPNRNQVLPADARSLRLTWFISVDGECPQ